MRQTQVIARYRVGILVLVWVRGFESYCCQYFCFFIAAWSLDILTVWNECTEEEYGTYRVKIKCKGEFTKMSCMLLLDKMSVNLAKTSVRQAYNCLYAI